MFLTRFVQYRPSIIDNNIVIRDFSFPWAVLVKQFLFTYACMLRNIEKMPYEHYNIRFIIKSENNRYIGTCLARAFRAEVYNIIRGKTKRNLKLQIFSEGFFK